VVWLAKADNVLVKARHLARVAKANFDPNQPRVPRGTPDGGQWTRVGGGSGRVRIAQNIPPEEERDFEENPASEVELAAIRAEGQELARRVREIDPKWNPSQSLTGPDSIESDIARARGERDEAEARLRELAQESPRDLMEAFRQSHGTDLLGDPIWSRARHTVAFCKVDDMPFLGINSDAPTYTGADRAAAEDLRRTLIEKYPETMSTDNVGQFPNDSLFHAEVTCLLRAARANGGSLERRTVVMHVDRTMCDRCEKVLPLVGLDLGDPIVTFVDPNDEISVMHNGTWK
jgi:hypothetical protein